LKHKEEHMSKRRSEQINDGEVVRLTIIRIRTPWVEVEVDITEEQAARWQADPDLCAARYFGLSVEEYREWVVETDGTPLCGARTKSGHLCRNAARYGSFDAETWKRLHRRATLLMPPAPMVPGRAYA
jgi:hypothetical protein